MKNFVTKCIVGDMTTEAEGNSKKLSKKRAAEMMLDELKRLPSVPVVVKSKLKSANNKKKNRNIIKVCALFWKDYNQNGVSQNNPFFLCFAIACFSLLRYILCASDT